MLKQFAMYAALAVFLATVISSPAQAFDGLNAFPTSRSIEAPGHTDQISRSTQSAASLSISPQRHVLTRTLLADIVTWLSAHFDLSPIHDYPRVQFVPTRELFSMRYRGALSDRWRDDSIDPAMPAVSQRDVVAVYSDAAKTIFLSETWTGATAGELSVLVHEMVHHLQNLANLAYECPAAREKLAYQAQDRWLKLSGTDLEKEFDIDMLTQLVSSKCMN